MILDQPVIEENTQNSSKKIILSAGTGIAGMITAILLLIALTYIDGTLTVAVLLVLPIVALGFIAPIWMFIRAVRLLLKMRGEKTAIKTSAIFLTVLLGFFLFLLFVVFVLYARADRQ